MSPCLPKFSHVANQCYTVCSTNKPLSFSLLVVLAARDVSDFTRAFCLVDYAILLTCMLSRDKCGRFKGVLNLANPRRDIGNRKTAKVEAIT